MHARLGLCYAWSRNPMERITMRTPRVIPADTDPIVVPVTRDDFLRAPADSRCAPADAPPLTDDPRDVRYPGRMTAFPDTPNEDLF